jgi:predicted RNA-binding Zn ribbon-like protein
LGQLFGDLKTRIGLSASQRLFDTFASTRVPSKSDDRNKRLLDLFDLIAEQTGEPTAPRKIATFLDQSTPGKFGNSVAAIEKQIRRLVRARKKDATRQKEVHRRMLASLLASQRKLAAQRKKLSDSSG